MPPPPPLEIDPPLLNTANPWATDLADLTRLYDCPHTGAVTTRTSLLGPFAHDPEVHQYVFFDAAAHDPAATAATGSTPTASLNTLGYSPLALRQYLEFIKEIAARPAAAEVSSNSGKRKKGFVVSVTGGPGHVADCYSRVAAAQRELGEDGVPLAVEVNLSCPNIPGAPPPAYDGAALLKYLEALQQAFVAGAATEPPLPRLPVGFKTPPYTHAGEFDTLIRALYASADLPGAGGVCPLSFLTATNTLGSCLVMTAGADGISSSSSSSPSPALAAGGIGGMAGAPLHPLALGNVATLRRRLDSAASVLGHIRLVGAGGVADAGGFARMRHAGAYAVGVGTALGVHGVDVFETISKGGVGK